MSERFEEITLLSGGALPGLPGQHGPGTYRIDWQARTIANVLDAPVAAEAEAGAPEAAPAPLVEVAQALAHLEEEVAALETPAPAGQEEAAPPERA